MMSIKVEMSTTEIDETASASQVVGTNNQFIIGGAFIVQLQAFQGASGVTVQLSLPAQGGTPLIANMSQTSPTGEINIPSLVVTISSGENVVNFKNLRVSLTANYNGSTPVNVGASLLLDVSPGQHNNPVTTVGATYLLGF